MVERNLEKMTAELQEWEAELQGKLGIAKRKFEEETRGITTELARVKALIQAATNPVIQPVIAQAEPPGGKRKRIRKPIPRDQLLTPEELAPILDGVLRENGSLGEKEIIEKVKARAKEKGKKVVGLTFRIQAALKARKKD